MKQLFKDILGFFSSIAQVDLLLYFAVLILIILIVSLIYIVKTSEEEEHILENENEKEDLKSIVTTIENNKPPVLKLTDYEAEQEEKAIISYEELLEKNKLGNIHYEEENVREDLTIKKINLDSLLEKPKEEIKPICFFDYKKEEEFLKKLKALSQLLN